MPRPWDSLNEAASFAQLSGMDAITLTSIILLLVLTFHSNNEEYLQLEQCVRMLHGLLQILPEAEMMVQHQHQAREVMEGLKDALQKADILVRSFRESSVLYRFFMGWKQAGHLRQVQKNIDMYLHLYHVVRYVDTNRPLRSIADSIQGTSAIAAAAGTAVAIPNDAGDHLDIPSGGLDDDDDDIMAIASPQPDPQQPTLRS